MKKNLSETVKKIYLERKKTYGEADYKIKCESLKPELIVNKILDLYTNSQVVTFSNCGHWVMIEKTKEFNQYSLNFLKN